MLPSILNKFIPDKLAKLFQISTTRLNKNPKCARARKWNGFSLKMERTSLTVERRGH